MAATKVLIASDHAGFQLKQYLLTQLKPFTDNVEFVDLGPENEQSVDYPDYARKVAEAIVAGKAEKGILICGSGQGMAMTANRFKGVRAALCWDNTSAELSRRHNNANVLCLGARLIPYGNAVEIAKVWLKTGFEGGRHQKRVEKFESFC